MKLAQSLLYFKANTRLTPPNHRAVPEEGATHIPNF